MKINERSLIEGLSYALDVAEKSYFSHSKHVAYTSIMLAKELGLTLDEQKDVYITALLHDIGASNAYNVEEHCIYGRDILLNLPLKPVLAEYIYYHHEFFNGTGAFKLKGNEIPLISQIICLADWFDTSFRCLNNLNIETKVNIKNWIEEYKEQFNPAIVQAFSELIEREFILLDYFNHEFNSVLKNKIEVQGLELDYDGVEAYAQRGM